MFYFQMFLYRIQKTYRFQIHIQDAVGKIQKLVHAIYPTQHTLSVSDNAGLLILHKLLGVTLECHHS